MKEKKGFGKGMGILALALAVFIVFSGMGSIAAADSEVGLIAEWNFTEGNGNILVDSSGNGNNGTIYGATWIEGGGLSFDGDDYILVPNSPGLSGGVGKNLSVLIWYSADVPGGYLISKIATANLKDWSVLYDGFVPGLGFWYENNGMDRRFGTGSDITENNLHFGAFTFQRSTASNNAVLKLYEDENEMPPIPFYQDNVPADQLYDMPDSGAAVAIGYSGSYYNCCFFRGKIYKIKILERILSAEEMKTEARRIVITPTPTPTPTETPMPTPTPTPLTAIITAPQGNIYSEESVGFTGIAEGGTPPFTYTWTSDIDGTLSTTVATTSPTDEFSKTLTMGKHNIVFKIEDSAGQTATFASTLNVVKQKIKILVVAVGYEGDVSNIDLERINEMKRKAAEFYLNSSYGAIYLDFQQTDPLSFAPAIDLANARAVTKETLTQLLAELSNYDTIVIVDKSNVVEFQAYPPKGEKGLEEIMKPVSLPDITVAIVPIEGEDQFGAWVHEIGHTLGRSVLTSDTHPDPTDLLWDLAPHGNIAGWDLMAKGCYVYDGTETDKISQPTDMSTLSKIKLGWLVEKPISEGDSLITSTENMYYRDANALTFKPPWSNDVEYYIEARELNQPSYYYDWLVWHLLNNGIIIYKKNYDSNGKLSINILRSAIDISQGPTFKASDGTSAEFSDPSEFVRFKVVESNENHPYNAKIRIGKCTWCNSIEGFTMDAIIPSLESIGFSSIPDINSTSPDLDLHAYTPDGKHVGMNYSSGEYEMQIPGANASGDFIGGKEWIFVPSGTVVRYYVDSHDVQKYLEENPDVNASNMTLNYSIASMEYGENPHLVQLPDNNWTVAGRVISPPKENTIEPGITKEANTTMPDRYINGTVIDSISKTGISSATIFTGTGISVVTDTSGVFSLVVGTGVYDLKARLEPTYYANDTVIVSTVDSAIVQDIELMKKPTGNITGTVIIK